MIPRYNHIAKKLLHLNQARYLALIVIVITAVFFSHYRECLRTNVPITYDGDALSLLTGIQGYQRGDSGMFLPRYFPRLNAPGAGCWSDYPFEKLFSWTAGQLSKIFGLPLGCNLTVLLLQILNACSFYLCGARMRAESMNKVLLAACAILFGLAPYAFIRNLNHLALTGYFQLPIFALFLLWYGWPERVRFGKRGGLFLGLFAGLLGGVLSPYYLGPFLVLLTLLTLGKVALREWRSVGLYAGVVGSAVAGFVIQNLDTLLNVAARGSNHAAVSRDLWWMVKFGLYLPDLFFPRAHHWEALNNLSWRIYQGHVPSQLWGESQTAYVGMVAGAGLILLILIGIAAVFARKSDRISPYFWLSVALILFSLAGGVNYLIGSFGFQLLRATDRSSIMLSCFALYFLCEHLPVVLPDKPLKWIALFMIPIGIWDQVPKYPSWEEKKRENGWKEFESDREFFPKLETMFPQGGMIFELPFKDYPEDGPTLEMSDYEHFRPILHTEAMRISYGTVKGRGDTEWQKDMANRTPSEMLAQLKSRGFHGILINRKAYQDKGLQIERGLLQAGSVLLLENHDFIILSVP